jgi:uncharacterized membrane protein (DUF4010 family)
LLGADAPSLSLARLSGDGYLDPAGAASAIVGVALAATLGKVGIVAIGARGAFPLRVGGSLLLTLAAGAAVFFWLRF